MSAHCLSMKVQIGWRYIGVWLRLLGKIRADKYRILPTSIIFSRQVSYSADNYHIQPTSSIFSRQLSYSADKYHIQPTSIIFCRQESYSADKYHIQPTSIIFSRQVSYSADKYHIQPTSIKFSRQVSYSADKYNIQPMEDKSWNIDSQLQWVLVALFPGIKWQKLQADHSPPFSAQLRMIGAIPLPPPICIRDAHKDKFTSTLTSSSSPALQPWVGLGFLMKMSPATSIVGIRPPITTTKFPGVYPLQSTLISVGHVLVDLQDLSTISFSTFT